MLPVFLALFLSTAPDGGVEIPCQTVADCWLDVNGKAIKRPASKRGHPLPRGDCGNFKVWLRTQLTCEEHVCKAEHVGDKC
jgi:hypothetical protein